MCSNEVIRAALAKGAQLRIKPKCDPGDCQYDEYPGGKLRCRICACWTLKNKAVVPAIALPDLMRVIQEAEALVVPPKPKRVLPRTAVNEMLRMERERLGVPKGYLPEEKHVRKARNAPHTRPNRRKASPIELTRETVRDFYFYEQDTGDIWRLRGGSKHEKVTRTRHEHGKPWMKHVVCFLYGEATLGENIAWLMLTGSWPRAQVTHENGDTMDNRAANLRVDGQPPRVWLPVDLAIGPDVELP